MDFIIMQQGIFSDSGISLPGITIRNYRFLICLYISRIVNIADENTVMMFLLIIIDNFYFMIVDDSDMVIIQDCYAT